MAIGSVDYATPVTVNGFRCRNCTDVGYAKKGIDPEHPKSGPYNVDALSDPSRTDTDPVKVAAAQKVAEAKASEVVGYSPEGARFGQPVRASVYDVSA